MYRWHTGYPGGLKERTAEAMRDRRPTEILRKAILGMIPRNNLRHGYMEPRLHIYAGDTHPHTAQLPTDKVQPLTPVPRILQGDYHYGLPNYADPHSYQQSVAPPPTQPQIQLTEFLEKHVKGLKK